MRETVKLCHTFRPWLVLLVAVAACCNPNPREVEGALTKALEAVRDGDKAELFKVIDQRTRHAMVSIVKDRQRAAEAIQQEYPKRERAAALAALGDAVEARDAADLFSMRCDHTCLQKFRSVLGAPRSMSQNGNVVHVITTRGGELDLYHGSDTWYGIVWNTEELDRERDVAAAQREQVLRNARLYARQQELE